jgi:hypothetical protein
MVIGSVLMACMAGSFAGASMMMVLCAVLVALGAGKDGEISQWAGFLRF